MREMCDIYDSINHTTNYLEEMTSTLLPYINCMGITRGIKMPYNSLLQILQSKLVRKIINTFTLYTYINKSLLQLICKNTTMSPHKHH